MFDTLWPRRLQHARPSCPSLSPKVCSNACPLSQWCHPTISSSITPFCSCPQSFPASVFSNEPSIRGSTIYFKIEQSMPFRSLGSIILFMLENEIYLSCMPCSKKMNNSTWRAILLPHNCSCICQYFIFIIIFLLAFAH